MKVLYDKETDDAHILLSAETPDGAVEIAEGVILHTTASNKITGIEMIAASDKFPIKNLFTFEVEPAGG